MIQFVTNGCLVLILLLRVYQVFSRIYHPRVQASLCILLKREETSATCILMENHLS